MLATVVPIRQQPRPFLGASLAGQPPAAVRGHTLDALLPTAVTMRADRDEEIVAQGQSAGYCYLIVTGCARTVKLMEDGRRQLGEFFFAGDLFGWEALDQHDFGVEAVTPVTLLRYSRGSLYALADRDRILARRLREITARQLRAGRERLVLLGRKTASERIASFLLEMAERISPDGGSLIELPMSRADMADYLGLTIETVCRGLTQLRRHGVITVERSKVVILNRNALGTAGCELAHQDCVLMS